MAIVLGALFEIIVYCRDMQAQVQFYRDALGIPVAWPPGLADYSGEDWVTFQTEGAVLALHSGGQGASGTPPRFGWRVSDIEAARSRLLEAGVRCALIRAAAPGIRILDCWDPEGNAFFLDERA